MRRDIKHEGSDIVTDRTKKVLSLLLDAVLVLFMFASVAPRRIYADGNKSITLECRKDDIVLTDMKWRLFRVGERSSNGFVLTGDFSDCYADLTDMSVENISMAAQTIESFILEKRVVPLAEKTTDENGELVFSGISSGLYLAIGYPVKQPPFTYEPSPLLLEVTDGGDNFRFDAYPKIIRVTLAEGARGYTVKKVWVDENDLFEARPTYVTVDLFRNGELFDTVTLNEENNWQHRWYSLDVEYQWRVAERVVPVNYEVRIERNDYQFLIRNRHKTVEGWGEVTRTTVTSLPLTTITVETSSVSTSHRDSTLTSVPTTTDFESYTTGVGGGDTKTSFTATVSTSVTTSTEKLPQTGQLWWPVIPLSIGGVLLVFIGFLLRPSKKDE